MAILQRRCSIARARRSKSGDMSCRIQALTVCTIASQGQSTIGRLLSPICFKTMKFIVKVSDCLIYCLFTITLCNSPRKVYHIRALRAQIIKEPWNSLALVRASRTEKLPQKLRMRLSGHLEQFEGSPSQASGVGYINCNARSLKGDCLTISPQR